jgi:hypothetical protein
VWGMYTSLVYTQHIPHTYLIPTQYHVYRYIMKFVIRKTPTKWQVGLLFCGRYIKSSTPTENELRRINVVYNGGYKTVNVEVCLVTIPLEIRISSVHGQGLFTATTLKPGIILGEYTGGDVFEDPDNGYVFETEEGFPDVDAKFIGNEFRFLNNGNQNANVCGCGVDGKIYVLTMCDIKADSELLLDYGYRHTKSRISEKRKPPSTRVSDTSTLHTACSGSTKALLASQKNNCLKSHKTLQAKVDDIPAVAEYYFKGQPAWEVRKIKKAIKIEDAITCNWKYYVRYKGQHKDGWLSSEDLQGSQWLLDNFWEKSKPKKKCKKACNKATKN